MCVHNHTPCNELYGCVSNGAASSFLVPTVGAGLAIRASARASRRSSKMFTAYMSIRSCIRSYNIRPSAVPHNTSIHLFLLPCVHGNVCVQSFITMSRPSKTDRWSTEYRTDTGLTNLRTCQKTPLYSIAMHSASNIEPGLGPGQGDLARRAT
jgi:hypothetical protein